MIHDIYTPQIRSLLFGLADEVADANKLNLHDAAINCENLIRDLFNLTHGYKLQNSNQGNLIRISTTLMIERRRYAFK
jgi:hypothetical protein